MDELDRNDNSGLSLDIVYGEVLDACEDRDGDPLMTPQLATCAALIRSEIAIVEALPCVGTDECAGFHDDARTKLQAYLRAMRLSDRAAARRDCRAPASGCFGRRSAAFAQPSDRSLRDRVSRA